MALIIIQHLIGLRGTSIFKQQCLSEVVLASLGALYHMNYTSLEEVRIATRTSMDAASYLIFMFLPALVLLTAFCMYNKIKETRAREERLRRMGYPNPPAFDSPLRLPPPPSPNHMAPPYCEAVNMRRETVVTIDYEHFNAMRQTYFEDTAHPIFSPFEPPPPYSDLKRI